MKNKIAEFKEQTRDEDAGQVSRDTEELATLLGEKTHLEDLESISAKKPAGRNHLVVSLEFLIFKKN